MAHFSVIWKRVKVSVTRRCADEARMDIPAVLQECSAPLVRHQAFHVVFQVVPLSLYC